MEPLVPKVAVVVEALVEEREPMAAGVVAEVAHLHAASVGAEHTHTHREDLVEVAALAQPRTHADP